MANWTETLALVRDKKTGHATIQKASANDNPAACFEVSQLDDLFATLAANKVTVSCDNFVMYGEEINERGWPKAIKAKHQREYTKDGEKRSANAAYSPEQIAAFVPVDYACTLKWGKNPKTGKSFPLPLFSVYAAKRTQQATEASVKPLAFARATASAAAEKPLERASAKK